MKRIHALAWITVAVCLFVRTSFALTADPKVATFDAFLADRAANDDLVGFAIAVVDQGQLAMVKGYGKRSLASQEPVDTKTVFHIASLSKTFAAGLTGLLVRDHVLDWSMPLKAAVPQINLGPKRSALTISDILSHRTGLPANAYDDLLDAGVPVSAIMPKLARLSSICPPGTCYAYQNIVYNLITDVIQAKTGHSYQDLVQKRIFTPLRMTRASFGSENLMRDDNWARPYVRARGGWREVNLRQPYYALPAASGINASITDMAQWLLAQMGRAQTAYPIELASTLQTPRVRTPKDLVHGRARFDDFRDASYGYGWRIYNIHDVEVVAHAGAVQGYTAQIAFIPDQKTGIVILSNSTSPNFRWILPAFMALFADGVQPKERMIEPLRRQTTIACHPLPQTVASLGPGLQNSSSATRALSC